MSFDLRSALRSLKPEKRFDLLKRRSDSMLRQAVDEPDFGEALLLDTCVYFDVLQNRTPAMVDVLLKSRLCHHSAVCAAELTHVFGRLDPLHPGTRRVWDEITEMIEDIPDHRLHAPGNETWGEAGILAGALARLRALPKDAARDQRFLNDALIALQARRMGASVLTRNIIDFDFLGQLVPDLQVIFYRTSGPAF